MQRLYTSRKLWGALLGSICIMVIVKITPETQIATAIMALGALWGAAIGGQAYSDIIKEKRNQE